MTPAALAQRMAAHGRGLVNDLGKPVRAAVTERAQWYRAAGATWGEALRLAHADARADARSERDGAS